MTDPANVFPLTAVLRRESAEFSWLAVWTKPRAEKTTAKTLQSRAVPVWLPTMNVRRRWSDRWKEVQLPIFPCYLFAQASADNWWELLKLPGVLTVVKHERKPAWIADAEIEDLRGAVARIGAENQSVDIVESYEPGEKVRVLSGPMAGIVGIVREVRGSRRLLIGIEKIGRSLSVSIGSADVERWLA